MMHPKELGEIELMEITANVKSALIVEHKFTQKEINDWVKANPKLVTAFLKETYKAVRARLEKS